MRRNSRIQTLLPQPLLTKQPIGVSISAITKDRSDRLSGSNLLREFVRRDDVQSGASTHVQSLLIQQSIDHMNRVLIRNPQCVCDEVDFLLEVVGDTSLTNALGDAAAAALAELAAALDVAVQHGPGGVREPALGAAVGDFLQVAGDAGKGASGSRGAGKSIQHAAGLRPQLRPGGFDVSAAVRGVVELVCPDCVLEAFGVTLCLVVVVLRVLEGDGGDRVDFCAEETEQVDFGGGLSVRHVDHAFVPFAATHVGQADTGVARCAFHHRAARLDQAALLGVFDNVQCRAICIVLAGVGESGGLGAKETFHGAAGVHELCLPEDFAAGFFGELVEPDQRRVSDCYCLV
jgi:hypothetical protein